MELIVCHDDDIVKEGYIKNGGVEIKLFTCVL